MKIRGLLLIFLLALTPNLYAIQVDAENIPSSKYFEVALSEISNAKTSIEMYMYLISVIPDQPESQSTKLVQALIAAQGRGVSVKVVLDQNIDFTGETGRDDAAYQNKNQAVYEFLKRNNVPVFFDEADTYTHAKAIIIDNETVILGSTNWSKAALTRNNEANALIRSKEFAANLLQDLARVKLQEGPVISLESVLVPRGFLQDKNLFSQMVASADERAFDIYLYILKEYNGNAEAKATLGFEKLAESLGIQDTGNEAYRRQIIKVLEKLQDKYKLITLGELKRNQDAEVVLKSIEDARKRYEMPKTEYFEIPAKYFKYGWNRKLSLPAKAVYLVNLSKSKKSNPSWFMSREAIAKGFNISETFITDGVRELKRLNLLDVEYDAVDPAHFGQRLANVYTPLELYDPVEHEAKLKELGVKYGMEKLDRARKNAAIVFEENSLKMLTALIELENQYGQAVVDEAAKKMAEKNADNPKRSAGYFINTIKSMGSEKKAA